MFTFEIEEKGEETTAKKVENKEIVGLKWVFMPLKCHFRRVNIYFFA